jgi:transposase
MESNVSVRSFQVFSTESKRKIVEEYLAGGISLRALMRKYKFGGNATLYRWMKKLGYVNLCSVKSPKFTAITPLGLSKKIDSNSENDLVKKIKELERQLQDEKLRSEAYARIIEKAEKELQIPIRKKPNTR